RTVLFGVPSAVLVLGLIHPVVGDDPYADLHDRLTLWFGIHLVLPFLVLALAAALYLLVDSVSPPWRTATRATLAFFLVFYGAFDAVVGIGTGELVRNANAVPSGERSAAREIASFYGDRLHWPVILVIAIGGLAWAIASTLAAIGLRRAGFPLLPVIALVL